MYLEALAPEVQPVSLEGLCLPMHLKPFPFFFFDFFNWIIFFIYISNIIPFPNFPAGNPYPIPPPPASMTVFPYPPTLPPCPYIPLHLCIEPSHDQGPLLPLMPNKATLC